MEDLFYYPFRCVRKFNNENPAERDFLFKWLYSFDSTKTNHTYWVWVEVYCEHFYAVKFHLKEHRDSPRKYNLLTGLNEVRPVVNTCIMILREIAEKDPLSSFGFIGANSEGESIVDTKRFRVYHRLINTYFGNETFRHYFFPYFSAYVMLRASIAEADPNAIVRVSDRFIRMYDYFEP